MNPDIKSQMRSISVSGFQSQVSASHYVLPMLALAAPSGSSLSGLGTVTTFGLKHSAKSSLAYDSDLGLYYSTATSGATITASYYTDAAGTQSAGFIKGTLENATSFNTSYSTYPQTIDVQASVTAGNIIANGTVKVSFTDSTGTNTLVGTINAPQKGISAQLNMSLASSGAVGGTMTVVQNGLTSVVSNLTGDISSGFNGTVVVSPGNLQGTATINLLSESFTLHLSNGTTVGDTTATPTTLTTTYSDGSSLTISSPIAAPVAGSGTTSSGSTGGGSGISNYTVTAISGNPSTINQVTPNGHMLGQGTSYPYSYYYWDTPSSTPQAITLDKSLNNYTVSGMNTKGNLVGYAADSNQLLYFLYWSSASAQPVRIAIPNFTPIFYSGTSYPGGARATVLSDGRIILLGSDASINASHLLPDAEQTWVYSGPTDTSPYRVAGFAVISASDNGSALAMPTTGTPAGGTHVLAQLGPNPSSIIVPGTVVTSSQQALLQNDGTVIINDIGYSTAWLSHGPTYADQVFPNTTGLNSSSSGGIQLTGETPSGGLLGTRLQDNNGFAAGCVWTSPTAVPQNLGSYYPKFMTTSGAIIAYSNGYQLLTPKS